MKIRFKSGGKWGVKYVKKSDRQHSYDELRDLKSKEKRLTEERERALERQKLRDSIARSKTEIRREKYRKVSAVREKIGKAGKKMAKSDYGGLFSMPKGGGGYNPMGSMGAGYNPLGGPVRKKKKKRRTIKISI